MEDPSLDNVCPYCFAPMTLAEDRFKLWPPWVVCSNCGKRFGRDRCGRTVKIQQIYMGIIVFVGVIAVYIYLMMR